MANFLVMTVDKGTAEAGYKKGDIVEVFPDGRLQPQPTNVPFVLIRVPGMAVNTALHGMWQLYLDYTVVASNALGKRIKVFSKVARSSDNLGGITKAKIQTFLDNHNATVVSFAPNEVVFDIANGDIQALKDDLRSIEGKFVRRRLYRVPNAAVDAALANGGVMTYTEAQVLTYLQRKAD